MEINKTPKRIHPLVAIAAVSVTLVSLAGVASITGLLPSSHSTTAPTTVPTASVPAGSGGSDDGALAAAMDSKAAASENPSAAIERPSVSSSPSQPTHASRNATRSRHSQPSATHGGGSEIVAQAPKICTSCGRVESVETIKQEAKPTGLGVAAGAVLGGALGNQVGGGKGRTLATVAGAVGGGYAGNEIEKRARATTSYEVRVRMENGSLQTFPYAALPEWHPGDRVRIVNGKLAARE
ncbi:MAG TPA: glycine zipper 2TM domain-containing protein [Burkholderiaceae bacterium]|jgi:outer membrane lipoprotein SlyB|nr:glycine zipper 2TM domain-containing protein [Burkholderiaceae bacterium]